MPRRVRLTSPPDVDIRVRCVECVAELPVGDLFTLEGYLMILRHITDLDHQVVITGSRR